jgi:hypothetical protein
MVAGIFMFGLKCFKIGLECNKNVVGRLTTLSYLK